MSSPSALEQARAEIDRIDDEILALLDARFATVAKVRAAKALEQGPKRAAFRPAREAQVLRRLLSAKGEHVPARLLVRLWRTIMGWATQVQGSLPVHASENLLKDATKASLLGTQFAEIRPAASVAQALQDAAVDNGIAAVGLDEDFASHLGDARVVGSLGNNHPALFLVGPAILAEASGEDETLILANHPPANILWQDGLLCGLSGFLEPADLPANVQFLGRYPRPPMIDEVSP